MSPQRTSNMPKIAVRRVDRLPYATNRSELKRFSIKNTIFERVTSDPSWKGYMQMYDKNVPSIVKDGKPGYSRIDYALSYASWTVHDAFKQGFSHTKIKIFRTPKATVGIDWTKTKHEVKDPHEMSVQVKQAARLSGASVTGICRLNRDWLYAEAKIPKRFKNAIVMAIEMDLVGIATSPALPAAAATGAGYSRMASILACMGEFVRNLGYEAIQSGNDTALSVPISIDAGLGELGRNGLLITPQYGPRVRLCKIFTDLPLEPDKPVEFGVKQFCEKCKLCAKHCKARAISMDDKPSFKMACRSNNPGAMKWYVDAEACYQFWCENGADCSTCISTCPYNLTSTETNKADSEPFWRSASS